METHTHRVLQGKDREEKQHLVLEKEEAGPAKPGRKSSGTIIRGQVGTKNNRPV